MSYEPNKGKMEDKTKHVLFVLQHNAMKMSIVSQLIIRLKIIKKGKEVIQPQVPLRLPCDDLTHLTESRFNVLKKASFT